MAGNSNLKASTKTGLQGAVIKYVATYVSRDPNSITSKTILSDLGLDGFDIAQIGDEIDETAWLHGVYIGVDEWTACNTIGDMVKLISKHV